MKIGIITFTYGDNYGQRLQNFAMQEFMRKYFDDVYTIKQVENKESLKRKIKKIFDKNELLKKERHKNFLKFDNKYINYYQKPISEKLSKSFPIDDFDYFVVGSDQVWSPYSPDVNSTMFLTFAPVEKRIAFAPSLACEEIPSNRIEEYKNYFVNIKYISTREEKGSNLVQNLIGKNVPTFLDPTLLHNYSFWENYAKQPSFSIPKNYCLCYCLGIKNDFEEIHRICRKRKLEMIDLMADKNYFTLGPCEFLYLIKNAKLVITDSYHGTIFSYIFHKPFLNFKRKGSNVDMNSRFETLYNKFGIKPRYLYEIDDNDIFNVDFNSIDQNIKKEIEKSTKFIESVCDERKCK